MTWAVRLGSSTGLLPRHVAVLEIQLREMHPLSYSEDRCGDSLFYSKTLFPKVISIRYLADNVGM